MRNRVFFYRFLLLIFMLWSFLFFQNCSEVQTDISLSQKQFFAERNLEFSGNFCLPKGYSLKKFMILNRSVIPGKEGVLSDLDQDLLPGAIEDAIGMDKSNPISSGVFLDGICNLLSQESDCSKLAIECDENKINEFGLSDCDFKALNLKNTTGFQLGSDTDGDFILDILEIANGLDPSSSDDANLDNDKDGVLNIDEIINGTNPLKADSDLEDVAREDTLNQINFSESGCEYDSWEFFSLKNKVYEFKDFRDPISEDKNINRYLIFYFAEKPLSTLQTERKIYYTNWDIRFEDKLEGVKIKSTDFLEVDNYFFKGGSVE